jgi:glycosyltransferase involved in cell wall biosynthesis
MAMAAGFAPDISVLTPSFGYGRFIRDCLVSVQRQEGIKATHRVQDGGSTDETVEILREFSPAVEWRSEPDRSQSDALNKALETANGAWVGWLNADEFYLPGGLAALMEAGERTGADVVYADAALVDEDGRFIRLIPQHRFDRTVLRWYGCFIWSCATIIRSSFAKAKGFDPALVGVFDWDVFLRMESEGARFAYLPFPVACFRAHGAQLMARPVTVWGDEQRLVRERYGIPRLPLFNAGRVLHGARKVLSGAYVRQYRTRSLRGADMRWFDSPGGIESYRRLMASGYRTPAGLGAAASPSSLPT